MDEGQDNPRVRLEALTMNLDIQLYWSAEKPRHSAQIMERAYRFVTEQLKNMGLDKTSFKPDRTAFARWPTTHQAQSLDLSNHN